MKNSVFYVILLLLGCSRTKEKISYPMWTEADRDLLISEFEMTQKLINELVRGLNVDQWNYQPDETTWSIAHIIEHLQLQEDMHYREVRIVSMQPPMLKHSLSTIGNDEKVNAYATNPIKTKSDWNVMPLGRWSNKELALHAFNRSRNKMIELVKNMKKDLRQQITFRPIDDEHDFRKIRNLHQILLTTIAHTKRHIHQIRQIIDSKSYPKL